MYFYPKHIRQDAIDALRSVGFEFQGDELFIPDSDYTKENEDAFSAKGVRLVRRLIIFSGHRHAPKTYSSLYGDMVHTGWDQDQCSICGYWTDRKMTLSDAKRHEQQCCPQYEWILG